MARINLFFLLSTVFAYGGYHVPELLPAKQRNWLEKIVDNLHGKISRNLRNWRSHDFLFRYFLK